MVWVGIPHFYYFDTPNELEFGFAVNAALKQLNINGWNTGTEAYLAAHSVSGEVAQAYV